ncbi:endonuclease/exonuclease/phosphatase family protein [Paraburkholderia pallida]|uniref:Endonuclease/exonuclease/phosphatase family protein n=1 Tax=Paraburkholderia pallida TaxID=2547399 RepID=A0A4P7CYY5_9BURK|nr:endonuclease/exonuclease/phosphatase family protein [Paraburkholderia pallida]QBR01541.1 endonuclease/exonuclease/phosphatase family protein [Paraburkholderia pallida]
MRLKVFTWNMQRGGSIGTPRSATQKERYDARKKILLALCKWGDVGFITEAGKDLVAAVTTPNHTSAQLPMGYGWWNCSQKADGQKGKNDCKNLLFSKRILRNKEVNFRSGADDCYRFPAAGYFDDPGDGARVLLITLHATSGGGGGVNSNELLDHLDETPRMRHRADVVLVGGDMNCNHRHFAMPTDNTHQSGSKLDGFVYEVYDDNDANFVVRIEQPEVATFAGNARLVETGDPLGYFLKKGTTWVRVSDHAPVLAEVEIALSKKRKRVDSDDESD